MGIVERVLTTLSLRSSTTTNSRIAWLERWLSVMAVLSALPRQVTMVQPIAKLHACWAGAKLVASTALPLHRQRKAHAWDVQFPQSILAWNLSPRVHAAMMILQPWMHSHKEQHLVPWVKFPEIVERVLTT